MCAFNTREISPYLFHYFIGDKVDFQEEGNVRNWKVYERRKKLGK